MHIEYLEEFIALGQCLSFTEAAKHCNITQPALSKHLASLERELGVQLVDRDRHNVELSQAGHALLKGAVPICEQYRSLRERVQSLATLPTLRIGGLLQNPRVLWIISSALAQGSAGAGGGSQAAGAAGGSQAAGSSGAAGVAGGSVAGATGSAGGSGRSSASSAGAKTRHQASANKQAISCTYNQTLSKPFHELLAEKEVDLVFTYEDAAQREQAGEGFSRLPLFDDHFVAVMPADNPLAEKDEVSIEDLAGETFIKLSGPYFAWGWDHIEAVCRSHGFAPKTRTAIMQPGLDYSLVNLDGSIMILSSSALTGQLFTRMKAFRCVPVADKDALFSICAMYLTGNKNRSLKLFLQQMADSLGE